MKRIQGVLIVSIISLQLVIAGGPKKIAKIDRSLWPYEINSVEEFDYASKMEMLVFVEVFEAYNKITEKDSIRKLLGIENISIASINIWKDQIRRNIQLNFKAIKTHSVNDKIKIQPSVDWQKISNTAEKLETIIPENLNGWYAAAKEFYTSYVYEQMRLASLFPRITSEILTLQNSEVNGTEYADKQFLLTFDDGPTVAGGNTDKLIATLEENKTNGVFFVLGDRLDARIKASSADQVQDLYKNMELGSHGKVHKQHTKYSEWQTSLSFTHNLINKVEPESTKTKYFRPPYGQRNNEIINYLNQYNTKVMLWNIDSQDWNAKISSKETADRVVTLMLLWRKGIILYHDSRSKANEALPVIWESLKGAGVNWMDVK